MIIYLLGFVSQLLFFSRSLHQWLMSERAGKVVSPTIYWVLSIIASYLFCIYGWFRNDFSILLGQVISYYIYIWNLNAKDVWTKLPGALKAVLILTPLCAIGFILNNVPSFVHNFLLNIHIPLWLLIFGSVGQVIFTLRFVYQWIYSVHRNESMLPLGFWIISLAGAGIIVIYGMIRLDPILILGQSVGFIAYSRNIILYRKELKTSYIHEAVS